MRIAPYTERWNEGERDWQFVKDARADIEAWEQREGLVLPESYRRFMQEWEQELNHYLTTGKKLPAQH